MVLDAIVSLLSEVDIIGTGMALGILGLIVGIVRGMTKDDSKWVVTFSALSWLSALVLPNMLYAGILAGAGMIGMTFSLSPILTKLNSGNIFIIGGAWAVLQVVLLISVGAFSFASYTDAINYSFQDDLYSLMGTTTESLNQTTENSGLCTPTQINNGECEESISSGTHDDTLFDSITSSYQVGAILTKGIKMMGMIMIGPFIIAKYILLSTATINGFIINVMALFMFLWNIGIFVLMIRFILNKRGES